MAAAFIAQMCSEELVVPFKLMHAEFSRGLRANEAEHQRLWETIDETTSDVGNLGGKTSNVQHVLDGTANTARHVPNGLLERRRRPGSIRAWTAFTQITRLNEKPQMDARRPRGGQKCGQISRKAFNKKENGCGLLKIRSSTMLES